MQAHRVHQDLKDVSSVSRSLKAEAVIPTYLIQQIDAEPKHTITISVCVG